MLTLVATERSLPPRLSAPSHERRRVAEVLRAGRMKLRISQEEMAQRVGLSYAGYRPYEQGKRELSMEQIPTFAGALEVTPAELARQLGLGDVQITSIRAAEIEQLLAQVRDEEAIDDLMEAIRMMTRIASRTPGGRP